jgi:serine/threonine-protein kinase
VQTLLPILEGLGVVHERGIVHRDLKPANIFLARLSTGRRQPKVLDFGIASVRESLDSRTTAEGVLLGSPVYMSPEQARGLDVDARTDVWALSVMLYEMVTGAPPFEGRNHHAVLQAVVQDEPRSLVEHGIEQLPLWAIIKGGLAKDPDNRWRNAREFGRVLADWLVARGVTEDLTCASVQATWLSPPSSQTISSYPPVVLTANTSVSRDADTLDGSTPTPAPATRPTGPATGKFWEVSVGRPRATAPSMLLWLAAGILVGAMGTLLYASMMAAPTLQQPAAAMPDPMPTAAPATSQQHAAPATSTLAQPSASASIRPRAGSTSHH